MRGGYLVAEGTVVCHGIVYSGLQHTRPPLGRCQKSLTLLPCPLRFETDLSTNHRMTTQ